MEYPYYKNYTTKKEILDNFKKLQKYKIRKTHLLKLNSLFSIQVPLPITAIDLPFRYDCNSSNLIFVVNFIMAVFFYGKVYTPYIHSSIELYRNFA